MARIIIAKQVRVKAKVEIVDGKVVFSGGQILQNVPTLYDANGEYVIPVNRRFLELAEDHKDLSTDKKALLHYWSYLEEKGLVWNDFVMPKNHKPTHSWRNDLKQKADNGEFEYSTANTYVGRVVGFYNSAIASGALVIEDERFEPFKTVVIKIVKKENPDGVKKEIFVVTTDLRIKVPKKGNSGRTRSLNPLEREEIKFLVDVMRKKASKELRLLISLGCLVGLRINEAVTFPVKLIRKPLPGEKHIDIEIGPHVGVKTKYGKNRTVEMPAALMETLYKYSTTERRFKRMVKTNNLAFEKHTPIFINQRGMRYETKTIMKLWGDLRQAIRDEHCQPFKHDFHDLRASYLTYRLQSLLDAGIDPSKALDMLMGWAGHYREQTTWKYLTYLRDHEVRKNAMTMLDTLMEEALLGEDD